MSLLSGATRGVGGRALGRHLAKTLIALHEPRGLASRTIGEQIAELAAGADLTRCGAPIWHVHYDPVTWDEDVRARFWALIEAEFALASSRYASVEHMSGAERRHEHRCYDVSRGPGGRVVSLRFERLRREKIACRVAWEHDLALPPVPHLRAVAAGLRRDGLADIAAWVEGNPRMHLSRSIAAVTPIDRAIQERRGGPAKSDVGDRAYRAWQSADSGAALLIALAAEGLQLATGDSVLMVVDVQSGTSWPFARALGESSKKAGTRIGAKAVHARLQDQQFLSLKDTLRSLRNDRPSDHPAEAARPAATQPEIPTVLPTYELAMALRQLSDREAVARGRLAKLDSPITPPADLVTAQTKVRRLIAEMDRAHRRHDDAVRHREALARAKPTGIWAWIIGKTRRHGRDLTAAQKTVNVALTGFHKRANAHRMASSLLKGREAGWDKKVALITSERDDRRREIAHELTAILAARAALTDRETTDPSSKVEPLKSGVTIGRKTEVRRPRPLPSWLSAGRPQRYTPR